MLFLFSFGFFKRVSVFLWNVIAIATEAGDTGITGDEL